MAAHSAFCLLVSGGFTFFTSRVAAETGFNAHKGNTLIDDGQALTGEVGRPILGREAKLEALDDCAFANGITRADALAMTGMIWRFAGALRRWFVIPALAVIVVDLAENTTQAMALMNNESLIGLKDVLTPAKFGLFALAALLVLVSVGLAIFRRFREKPQDA